MENIERELKNILRRLDSLEKNLELILKDRNMLENIELKLDNLNNTILLHREKQQEVEKNIKADVRDVQTAVEDKVDQVKKDVKEIVESKDILMVKPTVLTSIKKFLKIKERR